MQKPETWQGLPYNPISLNYKKLFGEKVFKIPVTTAETCPNREGLRGMQTCNFCDVWGSSAYAEYQELTLTEQIEKGRARLKNRINVEKFLVYFQAYTTTFDRVHKMRENFVTAASYPDVLGMVVGTRPDCVSDSLFELWNEYQKTHYVAVEYGVQTFNENSLIWMRRGHTAKKSIETIQRTAKACPGISIGVHLIFGLPDERDDEIILAARLCNTLPIDNVKLHNLHVLKHTPLADDYAAGLFKPVELDEYTRRVMLFLDHLDQRISVHRLTAVSSRFDELIAPEWVKRRMDNYQFMLDKMKTTGAYQGRHHNA
jgi:radical SAM protein (TIGR01212 family)